MAAARVRRYYVNHPERAKAAILASRRKNPDNTKAIGRRAYQKRVVADPAKERAKSRAKLQAWRLANPEKSREQVNRRRAQRNSAPSEPIDEAAIYERDGWVCRLCDLPVDPSVAWPDSASPSLDHVIPISKGGPHIEANVQLAHLGCNSRKRDN